MAALAPSVDLWLAETLSCTAEARLVRAVLEDAEDAEGPEGPEGPAAAARARKPLWLSFTRGAHTLFYMPVALSSLQSPGRGRTCPRVISRRSLCVQYH